jgi:hypothetical protein
LPTRWHIDESFSDRYRELDSVRGADVFVSDDEGASWRYRGGNIFTDSCFNEHSVVEKQAGKLVSENAALKNIVKSRQLGMNHGGG